MDLTCVLGSLSNTRNKNTKYMVLFYLFVLLRTIISPKIRVLVNVFLFTQGQSTKIHGLLSFFLSFANDHSTKIYGLLSFIISFMHNSSTKNYGPHGFISFNCIRPFGQNIWLSLIYSFFHARQFDQKLWSSLIYFFYLHTTIRPNLGVILTL